MLNKITELPITVYLAITGFARDFKKDQRGLSGVVVAILLILVAVLAVVLIWKFLGEWIKDMWENITKKSNIT